MHCLQNEEARSSVSCSLVIASVRSQPQLTDYTGVYDGFLYVIVTNKLQVFCAAIDDRR